MATVIHSLNGSSERELRRHRQGSEKYIGPLRALRSEKQRLHSTIHTRHCQYDEERGEKEIYTQLLLQHCSFSAALAEELGDTFCRIGRSDLRRALVG